MSHHHHHGHEEEGQMSFDEKMKKLLAHWIKHNIDHAGTYKDWAGRAKENNSNEVAEILEKAAKETLLLNQMLENAISILKGKK